MANSATDWSPSISVPFCQGHGRPAVLCPWALDTAKHNGQVFPPFFLCLLRSVWRHLNKLDLPSCHQHPGMMKRRFHWLLYCASGARIASLWNVLKHLPHCVCWKRQKKLWLGPCHQDHPHWLLLWEVQICALPGSNALAHCGIQTRVWKRTTYMH